MHSNVRILRLDEMAFNRQGGFLRRVIHAVVSLSLRLFFRRIETVNADDVPYKGALIFVMNHPNGLIDPALVFVALPRRISFLAKSTLFKIPILSYILRETDALPVYRRIDSADVMKNAQTFDAARKILKNGGAIALFPEGVSNNSPKLLRLKTGAARIALGAISDLKDSEEIDLKIVPVGLYYTNKTSFRSEALLNFGKAFKVDPVPLSPDEEIPATYARKLTENIGEALRHVTINAESEREMQDAGEAANLFFSVSESFGLEETLSRRSNFIKDYLNANQNNLTNQEKSVTERISQYRNKLRKLGIEPNKLSLSDQPFWYVFQEFFLRLFRLILLMPLSICGYIIHFPAYQLIELISKRYTRHGEDDIVSTVKILGGMILMPLTWIFLSVIIFFYLGWEWALLSIPISFICGYLALFSLEELSDLEGWFKSARLFISKRKLFLELIRERRSINRAITQELE